MLPDIERYMEEMFHVSPMRTRPSPYKGRKSKTPSVDPRKYDGYRREVVNGEEKEYVYEDGEWKQLPLNDRGISVTESSVTVDLSEHGIPKNVESVSDATLNNGILEVKFETEGEE